MTCTAVDCPCAEFRELDPAMKSLLGDQRGTDGLVIPLVAGTLAHCVLVSNRRHRVTLTGTSVASLAEHARLILKLADVADAPRSWERDRDALGTVLSFVLAGWDVLLEWVPEYYVPVVAEWKDPTTAGLIEAARPWVDRTQERTLTELVLFSAEVANRLVPTTPELLPIMGMPMRPIRVELAARLRGRNLDTWPRVLRASVQDWHTDALETLVFDYATAGNLPPSVDTTLREERVRHGGEPASAAEDDAPHEAIDTESREREPLGADVEGLLSEAIAQLDRAEARSRAIESKRLELADRYAALQGGVDRLTNDLASARQEITGLRSELAAVRRERDELASRVASHD